MAELACHAEVAGVALTVDVRDVGVDVVCTPKRVICRFALAPRTLRLLLRCCFPLSSRPHPLLRLLAELACLRALPVELPRPRVPPEDERAEDEDEDCDSADDYPAPRVPLDARRSWNRDEPGGSGSRKM